MSRSQSSPQHQRCQYRVHSATSKLKRFEVPLMPICSPSQYRTHTLTAKPERFEALLRPIFTSVKCPLLSRKPLAYNVPLSPWPMISNTVPSKLEQSKAPSRPFKGHYTPLSPCSLPRQKPAACNIPSSPQPAVSNTVLYLVPLPRIIVPILLIYTPHCHHT